ncbi:hypothetical protein PIB30_050407 [Stylosanthes scabra]|uniref:Uncharacterized protein n=1 Tax=Stylosanthes scabra TaxID=79078 RepID=A0ABU6WHK6_9FABA|nr:hypothetical protein [Stylosanthes scabra]
MPVNAMEDLPSPFGDSSSNWSESELRETAYEILVCACRSSGPKPLTFISSSDRGGDRDRDRSSSPATPAPSLHRSLTSTAASKVKKALGLKTKRKDGGGGGGGRSGKRAVTTGELVRVQMKISEQSDSRIRRALLRIAAGQADTSAQRLRRIIREAFEKPMDLGKTGESMENFRNVVISLAFRSFDGSVPETCHWADGFPLNLWIYQTLLGSCFDIHEETSVIEEVDEVLELIKKTWVMLGINEMLHSICFSWVLFHRYVATGQLENDLLFASSNLLAEVENDAKTVKDPFYSKVVSNVLSLMLNWAEKRLLAYHDTFHDGNIEPMESIVSIAVLSAKILAEYSRKKKDGDVAYTRVENYIRSSMRAVFAQVSSILETTKT